MIEGIRFKSHCVTYLRQINDEENLQMLLYYCAYFVLVYHGPRAATACVRNGEKRNGKSDARCDHPAKRNHNGSLNRPGGKLCYPGCT